MLNAFRVVMAERALVEAQQAEARRKQGDPPLLVGQLDGRGMWCTLLADTPYVVYTAPFNVTGQPAVSVPAGFGAAGLPLGVQLVGRANDEATLLSLAGQIEAERPWADRRPAIA